MAKWAADAGMDAALDYFCDADRHVLCSAQPSNYAGLATNKLGETPFSAAAAVDGTTSGRKRVVAAKSGVAVTTGGVATHLAHGKAADSTLRYVTTTPSQAVSGGGTYDTSAYAIEIADPS